MYKSINPATEELIQEYDLDDSNVETILTSSFAAFRNSKNNKTIKRLILIEKFRDKLEQEKDELARLISLEMGKIYAHALVEVERSLSVCDFLLENAEEILSERKVANANIEHVISMEPHGIVFAVMPWNFPVSVPLRSILPALVAGNSVIFKPAPNVSGVALKLKELFDKSGYMDLFQVVLLSNDSAEQVLSDKRVRCLAFTGSTETGSHLASLAGRHIKPSIIELGGSDPLIVLADADYQEAASAAASSRCSNAGQVCCCTKRVIVEEGIYQEFIDEFLNQMTSYGPGDPFDEKSGYGPLAREDLLVKLEQQLEQARTAGCNEILASGKKDNKGYFYKPGVLVEIDFNNPINHQEIFGPVACVYKVKNEDEAVSLANSSNYGLGASVFASEGKALRVAQQLENGMVTINARFAPHAWLPFGGVKDSGYGREYSEYGLLGFVGPKTITL